MVIVEEPICETCKWRWKDSIYYKCAAFPDGIPHQIVTGEYDHTKPVEGDNGIVYEKE